MDDADNVVTKTHENEGLVDGEDQKRSKTELSHSLTSKHPLLGSVPLPQVPA